MEAETSHIAHRTETFSSTLERNRAMLLDGGKLDGLMEERGMDAALATSGHNVQYLLGGYRFFMYTRVDSIGLSRYLLVVGFRVGKGGKGV
jgi:hypothetical protein